MVRQNYARVRHYHNRYRIADFRNFIKAKLSQYLKKSLDKRKRRNVFLFFYNGIKKVPIQYNGLFRLTSSNYLWHITITFS